MKTLLFLLFPILLFAQTFQQRIFKGIYSDSTIFYINFENGSVTDSTGKTIGVTDVSIVDAQYTRNGGNFNGSTSLITLTSANQGTDFDFGTHRDWYILAWVRIDAQAQADFVECEGVDPRWKGTHEATGSIGMLADDGSTTKFNSSTVTYTVGTWHLLSWRFEVAGTADSLIMGVDKTYETNTTNMGNMNNNNDFHVFTFTGIVDEIIINRGRTTDTIIDSLYDVGIIAPTPSSTNGKFKGNSTYDKFKGW